MYFNQIMTQNETKLRYKNTQQRHILPLTQINPHSLTLYLTSLMFPSSTPDTQ